MPGRGPRTVNSPRFAACQGNRSDSAPAWTPEYLPFYSVLELLPRTCLFFWQGRRASLTAPLQLVRGPQRAPLLNQFRRQDVLCQPLDDLVQIQEAAAELGEPDPRSVDQLRVVGG